MLGPAGKAKKTLTAPPCGLSKPVAAAQAGQVARISGYSAWPAGFVKMVEADSSVALDPADRAREADDPAFARRPFRHGQAAAARCRHRSRSVPDRLPDLRHAQCRTQQRGADLPRADRRSARRQPPSGHAEAGLVGDHGRSRPADRHRALFRHLPERGRRLHGHAPGRRRPIRAPACRWGLDFPVITIRDMVRAQAMLLDHLGIASLFSIAGGSMGGMQVLQWCASYPRAGVLGAADREPRPAIRRRTSLSTRSAARR